MLASLVSLVFNGSAAPQEGTVGATGTANQTAADHQPAPSNVCATGKTALAWCLGSVTNAAAANVPLAFPSNIDCRILAPTCSWATIGAVEIELAWPANAPGKAQLMAFVKDEDFFWFQNLLPGYPIPGATNTFRIDLSANAANWKTRGHQGAWHLRASAEAKEIGLRIFAATSYSGTCGVLRISGLPRQADTAPPAIRNVRANSQQVACFEKFELTFNLPDRYFNPFATNEVEVEAEFEASDGSKAHVAGFPAQDYYRTIDEMGEHIRPQGQVVWRVRFAPRLVGRLKYSLKVRDRYGESKWGPAFITVLAPQSRGFVRVSRSDPRFFEFDDGSYFFPVGHNIRSAFDTRYDKLFPLTKRRPEGTAIYRRYFKTMRENGENMTEVWMASWSMGLEWNAAFFGYHGIGRFNQIHAWELDQVVEEAERQGIYLCLVLNNHGKCSTAWDEEWADNPYNSVNGGFLDKPEQYFKDPRAREYFRRLLRYIVARWAYSRHIMIWKLWNELDLTGSDRSFTFHRTPEVLEWHREMGRLLKEMDPNDHLIGTHFCRDYTHQNLEIIALPEIDVCPVDAYIYSITAFNIVDMMRQTAQFNNPFRKPVVITEFGGSPDAAPADLLVQILHNGLWGSTAIPLGGVPLFWWWGLIDENDLYPEFASVAAFMRDEDRRGTNMLMRPLQLNGAATRDSFHGGTFLSDSERGLGWLYCQPRDANGEPSFVTVTNLTLTLPGLSTGPANVEFWDTARGAPVGTVTAAVANAALTVQVPDFSRDIAFKLKRPQKADQPPVIPKRADED